jgi:hypothetical protein
MSFRLRSCSALLAYLTLTPLLLAQNPTATMVGTVRDQSGAIVAGAALEIRNTDTDIPRKAVTNQRGEFTVPDLAPGPYEVTITHAGFRTVRQTDIVLEMDQVARIDIKLDVGAVSQTVEVVETGAPLINTDNGTKGQVMAADEIVEMPLNGRNITDLGTLAAGITPNNVNLQGSGFAINGARPDNTNFIIDGFSAREPLFGGVLTSPNLDSMQEFKMQTNSFSAEYGRMAGGVMNMVLKSGTNRYHGTLFEFLRNDAVDARSFFDVRKSELRQNQFGAMISGPVDIPKIYHGKDRTFFLFSWESLREVAGSSAAGVVPTVDERNGNFGTIPIADSLSTGTCPGSTGKGGCFPNNVIPQSRLTPTSLAIQKFVPLPNQGGINNLAAYAVSPTDFDSFIGKIDQRLTEKDTLAFRLTDRWNHSANAYSNAVQVGSNNTGLFGSTGGAHILLAGLTYTRLFAPTLINELRVAFTRTNNRTQGSFVGNGTDYDALFGLPSSTTNPSLIGFPQISVTGYQQIGPSDAFPIIYVTNSWVPGDTLTWVRSNHLFKFGADALHTQTVDPYGQNARGNYAFTGEWTGNSYADFLLGYLNSDGRLLGVNVNHLLATSYGFFGQDDWKVTPRLTLNLGLRYELNKPIQESSGRWSSFVPALGKVVAASLNSLTGSGIGFTNPNLVTTAAQAGYPQTLVYLSKTDFAPRFGFAWRPFGGNTTVVRGGYGIFYGGNIQNGVRTSLADVFPFVLTQAVTAPGATPPSVTWSNPFPNPTLVGNIASFGLFGYESHPPPQYIQSWNFTVERQIGSSSAIELSYVGSKGTHLGMQVQLNQPENRSPATPNGARPFPLFGNIQYFNMEGNSNYEGATATFKRRFVHGFFYTFNYTYSKSLDDASLFNATSLGGVTFLQNTLCPSCNRGRSDWDMGHMFTASFSWESPAHSMLLRGWQFAGTSRLNSGNPFTPFTNSNNATSGTPSLPNRLAKGTVTNPGVNQWFDVADFPVVPNNAYKFGNSGRNILDGPGTITVNQTIYRNFRFQERATLQARWELFNVLNHANFQLPVDNVTAVNAGTLTSVVSPGRQMQFGLRLSF